MRNLLSNILFFTSIRHGQNAVSYKIIVPYASITRSAYGAILEEDFDIVIRKTDGASTTDISRDDKLAEELLNLQMKNSSGIWADYLIGDSVGQNEMIEGLSLKLRKIVKNFDEEKNPLPDTYTDIEELRIPVVQIQPQYFARPETSWNASLQFKNGEYLLLDTGIYMWNHYLTGNSTLPPQQVMQENEYTTKWKFFQEQPFIFTKGIASKFADLAKIIFYDEYIMSQHGVDANGEDTYEYRDFTRTGNAFNPTMLLDFLTGEVILNNLKATGQIQSRHTNGMPASILNYKDDNVSYPGVSLWYDNGQVMECRQFDYDANGSMIGAETLVYDNTGKLLYKFDRLGIRKTDGLEQYWTYADRYAYRTATSYSTGQALLNAINDIRLEQYKAMPTNATLSTFNSETGKDNSSYDGKVFYGAMATGSDPVASSLFTGYVLTQLEPMIVSDTHFKREFYRYVNGVKQTAKLTVTLLINPI